MVNGNGSGRLQTGLLAAVLAVNGFLAVQVWAMNGKISGIEANRFTAQDALDHERIETVRFDTLGERIRQLELQVAHLPPQEFRDRVDDDRVRINRLELNAARHHGYIPPKND